MYNLNCPLGIIIRNFPYLVCKSINHPIGYCQNKDNYKLCYNYINYEPDSTFNRPDEAS